MLTPADLVNLPKGQAFALINGGQLYKIRMPLPDSASDPAMPKDFAENVSRHGAALSRSSEARVGVWHHGGREG